MASLPISKSVLIKNDCLMVMDGHSICSIENEYSCPPPGGGQAGEKEMLAGWKNAHVSGERKMKMKGSIDAVKRGQSIIWLVLGG